MNILLLGSILGLLNCAIAYEKDEHKYHVQRHHSGRFHSRHHKTTVEDDESAQPLTLPPPTTTSLSNYKCLNLLFNLEKKILGFANVSENVGFAYVVREEGIVKLLVDAKSGVALRFIQADNITRIQTSNTKGGILNVFHTILKIEAENGHIPEGSQIDQASEEARNVLSKVYLHVARKNDARSRSIKVFGRFVDKLKRFYLGSLTGILQGPNPVPLKQSLNRFLSITIGLQELFSRAEVGLKGILAKGIIFEVNPLYNGRNGAEVFVYILRQVGAKFNLATLWGKLLNDIEELLHIIQLLGGGESTNGVDETFGFLDNIWSALTLRLPIPALIKYLLEAGSEENWSKGDDGDFSSVLKDLKNITDEQSKKYDNSGLITPFVTFFSNLTANTLIQDGVNVSDLVAKWRRRDVIGGFRSVTEILLKFQSPEKYSGAFFNAFTAFLNTSSDLSALQRLFPGIALDQLTKQGGSLWDSISKSFNIDSLLKNNTNASEVLNGVPGFGEFSKIFKESFGSPFNFTKVLNGQTISDYLQKGLVWPLKWSSDFFHSSENVLTHIFWDPFKHLFQGLPQLIKLPLSNTSDGSTPLTTKPTTEKETEEDRPRTTICTSEASESSERSTVKTSTEIIEEKPSTTVEVEVSTESKGSTEFKQHHHKKHHENKHLHEVNHKHDRAHHDSKGHHQNRKYENNDKRSHSNLRYNSGGKHYGGKDEKLEKRNAHHRQEKKHETHEHLNA